MGTCSAIFTWGSLRSLSIVTYHTVIMTCLLSGVWRPLCAWRADSLVFASCSGDQAHPPSVWQTPSSAANSCFIWREESWAGTQTRLFSLNELSLRWRCSWIWQMLPNIRFFQNFPPPAYLNVSPKPLRPGVTASLYTKSWHYTCDLDCLVQARKTKMLRSLRNVVQQIAHRSRSYATWFLLLGEISL